MKSVFERFESNAARHPDQAAFIYFKRGTWETVTYRQLLTAARGFASALRSLGARAGMRAALMTPPSADFFPLALALLELGIVPIILDPAIGLKQIGVCLNEAQPELFIGNLSTGLLQKLLGWGRLSTKLSTSIPGLLRRLPTVTAELSTVSPPFSSGNPQVLPSASTAIIFTSGSTGLPKGVLYTQANFSAQLEMLVETFHISPDEIDLPAFPLYALIDVLLGVTAIIPDITFPIPKNINPALTLAAIQKFHVTNTFASPVILDRLAEYGIERQIKVPSLKRVITAGAPAPTHLQQRFRKLLMDETDLFGIYGATEALPIAIVESREIFADAQQRTATGAGIYLGKPVNGAEVRIIEISDAAIQEFSDSLIQPVNGVGEITVKGKSVTASYVTRVEANRFAKMRDGDEIVHRTGDVGYFDEQGRLWYCGRKSQRVVTADAVLFTEQIEGIFNVHPLVYRSALVGVDRQPVMWIELEKSARFADRKKIVGELLALAQNHPQAKKIARFLFAKKFPTDVRHNSKIIREKLAALAKQKQDA